MATLFSKIAAGEIPSYKCAEDENFYAFLDINPVKQGHTLVVPRKEVDYIFDMSDADLAAFEVFAKKVAKAIRTAFPVRRWPRWCWDSKSTMHTSISFLSTRRLTSTSIITSS